MAIVNSRGQYVQAYELYPLLGLKPGQHLPDEGFRKEVQGKMVYCDPVVKVAGRNSSKHRIKVGCDLCGHLIPFGRMGQHVKKRDHQPGAYWNRGEHK
jgi:hypothetical protein